MTTVSSETLTVIYENPEISRTSVKLYEGMTYQLNIHNAYDDIITWKTLDEDIASISDTGLITANSAGTCKVYAMVRGKILFCSVTVQDGICGDVNMDSKVSLVDAVWLSKGICGKLYLNPASKNNADCCEDGALGAKDILTLLRYLAALEETLPVLP